MRLDIHCREWHGIDRSTYLQKVLPAALVLHHDAHRLDAVHQLRRAHEREAHVLEHAVRLLSPRLVMLQPADGGVEQVDLTAVL